MRNLLGMAISVATGVAMYSYWFSGGGLIMNVQNYYRDYKAKRRVKF